MLLSLIQSISVDLVYSFLEIICWSFSIFCLNTLLKKIYKKKNCLYAFQLMKQVIYKHVSKINLFWKGVWCIHFNGKWNVFSCVILLKSVFACYFSYISWDSFLLFSLCLIKSILYYINGSIVINGNVLINYSHELYSFYRQSFSNPLFF